MSDPAELLAELDRAAVRAGAFLIGRCQRHRSRRVVVRDGRVEDLRSDRFCGLGLQLIGRDGRSAFGAVDRVEIEPALAALGALLGALREARRRRHAQNREVFALGPTSVTILTEPAQGIDHLTLPKLARAVREAHQAVRRRNPGVRLETSFGITVDDWTVTRSDGTVARWRSPRAVVGHQLSRPARGGAMTGFAAVCAAGLDALLDPARRELLDARAHRAGARLEQIAAAEQVPAGSYPLVIDYALAKGLAHEAFGHAAESDAFASSCLVDGDGFRRGLEVALPTLSIVDQPIYGDHAYQPVDSNGVPRRAARIVDRGKLAEGLTDVFTAAAMKTPLTGAARAQSYRSVPVPRMSNIRIEIDDARPLPRPFEAMEPEDVRELLIQHGLLGEPVAYLSGYRGGQVNPVRGDFMFNCAAVYLLAKNSIQVYRPAIFAGHFLSALRAVRAGFGPLILDAVGTCGKMGQQVPSSGGSNGLLFLEKSADVTIGGRR